MHDLQTILDAAAQDQPQALERLFDLIRIPSVSGQSIHDADCDRAADWLVSDLESIGFKARRIATSGHDIVLAHYQPQDEAAKARQKVIFYGHYDVQPDDPVEQWDSDAFTPELKKDERGETVIHGRGASDDKGQLMTFVEAIRHYKGVTGDLPCPITLLLEGDEENLSLGMPDFVEKHKDELDGGVVFVCDTGLHRPDLPAVSTSLRGIVFEEVILTASDRDLHSGTFGGCAQNAVNVLVSALGSMKNARGQVTLPGFYDGIVEPSAEVLAGWQKLGFDEKEFLAEVDLSVPAGEDDRTALERLWARPTMDINGILGGYTGEGSKTVIGNVAMAKVSFRLVPGQDPEKIQAAFRTAVQTAIPADCKAEFTNFGKAPGISIATDGPYMKLALEAAEAEWNNKPVLIGMGGSIPVPELFKRILGLDSILLGFALSNDRIHSPNEKYDLKSFTKGIATWIRVLDKLG